MRLSSELEGVQQLLHTDIDALGSPLNTLIHAQLPASYPLVRAAVVLTTATDINHNSCQSVDADHPPHILLAAALEMLHLAFNVHEILLTESSSALNKIAMGSMILTGDYCLSRSARLATKTHSPLVVESFARCLKNVSESHLRHLFDEQQDGIPYDPHFELFYTGMMASVALKDRPTEKYTALARELSRQLATQLQFRRAEKSHQIAIDNNYLDSFSQTEQERWSGLITWLNQTDSVG